MTTALHIIAELPKNTRECVRVSLDSYQGVDLVDVRVLAKLSESSGIMTPTKKGVSLRQEQLPALIDALRLAQREINRRGK